MAVIGRYVWAPILDFVMRQEPVTVQRRRMLPWATGRVLEIGLGSGLNLPFYDEARVEKVWGLEPAAQARVQVELMTGSAEEIPFDAASFDTVVTTFTLCSIPDVARSLREVRRVLKPAGRLVFAEHGQSSDPGVARWQDRLNPLWAVVSGGCNLNRPIAALVRQGGFEIERVETGYLPGPRVLSYNYWGTAVPG